MNKLTEKIALATLLTALGTSLAQAECYYAYKAKKENPLQLHFGVIRLEQECSAPVDQSEIAKRISRDGWKLLIVSPPLSATDLSNKKEEAGEYFLRY